jgi:hypothetical protein
MNNINSKQRIKALEINITCLIKTPSIIFRYKQSSPALLSNEGDDNVIFIEVIC